MKKLKILSLVLMLMVGVTLFSACSFFGGKTLSFQIMSDSMAPALEVGDKVKIKEKDEYVVGDIIAYTAEERLFLVGRVLFKFEEEGVTYFICRGDNNQNLDHTDSNGQWEDDAEIIRNTFGSNVTKQEITNEFGPAVIIVSLDQIEGYVYDVVKNKAN